MKKEAMKEAKKALKSYLEAWKKNNIEEMHKLCQKTYKVAHTKFQLKEIVLDKIESYKITSSKEITDVVCDFSIVLKIEGKQVDTKARVICEEEPFKPSLNGEWGINPISVQKFFERS